MNSLEELERLATQVMPVPWETKETVEYHGSFVRNALYLSVDGWTRAILFNHLAVEKKSAAYIVAACNAVPSLIARLRGLELKNSHLSNMVEGLEEHTDILRAKVSELEKQRDFLARCLLKQEKCFMPQKFGCSNRTPYGHYCHAESYQRESCIMARAEEMAKGEWEWD